LPAIVVGARELVLRYRRASWRTEALPESVRRVATRALGETRAALATGLTTDGVQAAVKLIAATAEADPSADPTSGDAAHVIADASAALAASAATARRAIAAAEEWPVDIVVATLGAPAMAPPQVDSMQLMFNAAASSAGGSATRRNGPCD